MVAFPAAVTAEQILQRLAQMQKPSASESAQAETSQHFVRRVLQKLSGERSIPELLAGEDFLSGSYVRFTKRAPLDDVDLMVPMNGTGLYHRYGNGVPSGLALAGTGYWTSPLLDRDFESRDGNKSSIIVLNRFRDALAETYASSTVVRDGQAVNVALASYGLGLDVVPCFRAFDAHGAEVFLIAEGHGRPGWIVTNPKLHARFLDSVATRPIRSFLRDLILLAKLWNAAANGGRLSPFHVEVMAIRHFEARVMISLAESLDSFFQALPQILQTACPDPAGLGEPIDAALDWDARLRSAILAEETSRSIQVARALSAIGREDLAAERWCGALGFSG
jgi:hypothetical protein